MSQALAKPLVKILTRKFRIMTVFLYMVFTLILPGPALSLKEELFKCSIGCSQMSHLHAFLTNI